MQDTCSAMEAVHAKGLTRHLGVSNFSVKKVGAPHACDGQASSSSTRSSSTGRSSSTARLEAFTSPPTRRSARAIVRRFSRLRPIPCRSVIKAIAHPAQVLLAWHIQRGISTLAKSINPARSARTSPRPPPPSSRRSRASIRGFASIRRSATSPAPSGRSPARRRRSKPLVRCGFVGVRPVAGSILFRRLGDARRLDSKPTSRETLLLRPRKREPPEPSRELLSQDVSPLGLES